MRVGSQSMVSPLRHVLLKHPSTSHCDQAVVDDQWQRLNYLDRPDFLKVCAQFDLFLNLLSDSDVKVGLLPGDDRSTLDSIYTHDPVAAVSPRGVILGSMGKPARKTEPTAMQSYLQKAAIPVLGQINGMARVEGGDVCWLDEETLAIGEGYRTNSAGIRQLRELLGQGVKTTFPVPLPHWTGPAECLHLLSVISPVDHGIAVVYSRLMPVPFREFLLERGYRLIEVPDQEYETFACNVLAVAPGICIMLEGNPVTQATLEAAGVEVRTFPGHDLCILGGGGPTCLTRPILRG